MSWAPLSPAGTAEIFSTVTQKQFQLIRRKVLSATVVHQGGCFTMNLNLLRNTQRLSFNQHWHFLKSVSLQHSMLAVAWQHQEPPVLLIFIAHSVTSQRDT